MPPQLRPLFGLGGFILGRHYYLHRSDHSPNPAKPRRSHKYSPTPNIATERLVWWG